MTYYFYCELNIMLEHHASSELLLDTVHFSFSIAGQHFRIFHPL